MSFKAIVCFLVLALSVGAGNARVLARQTSNAISVDGLSLEPSQTPSFQTAPAISVDGFSMMPSESPGIEQSTTSPNPKTPLESSGSVSEPTSATSNNHSGAIAGGVVGGFVIAAVAGVLLVRYRNKRSPHHWRNRVQRGVGGDRWHSLNIESSTDSEHRIAPAFDDHKSPIASPVTAKFSSPFRDPPGPHRLKAENIEMQETFDGY